MAATTPGIDVSQFQGKVDWEKVAKAGYRFVIIRASYGAKTTDSRFKENWDGAKAAGLLVSAYHFMLPALLAEGSPIKPSSATPEAIAQLQMTHFFEVLGGRKADFPLCLDVETDVLKYTDDSGQKITYRVEPAVNTRVVRECLRLIEAQDGRKAVIYSSRSKWNKYIERSAEWSAYPLWVASYVNDPATTTPGVPDDWTTWTMWQHSEKGNVSGITANTTDLDVFAGTFEALKQWTGAATTSTPPTSGGTDSASGSNGSTTSSTQALQAKVAVTSLNVRSGPSAGFGKAGTLTKDTVVTVKSVKGSDIWVRYDTDKWVAASLNNQQYAAIEPAASGGLQARVTANTLNIRKGAGKNFDAAGSLKQGDIVPVRDLGGNDVWVEYESGKWVALIFSGQRFMTIVGA